MSLLERRQQVAVAVESVPGTAETLAAFDAAWYAFRCDFVPDIEQFERKPYRDGIGRIPSIAGARRGTVSLETELTGSGSLANPPPVDVILRGCGYAASEVVAMEIGAITSGPFEIDELVTQTSSGATGYVAITTYDGLPRLYLYGVTGSFTDTDGLTGGTSGATATPSDADDPGGTMYRPRSNSFETVTAGILLGDFATSGSLNNTISGALGNLTLRFETGNRVMVSCEFQGALEDAADGTFLTGITYPTSTPPKFLEADVRVQDNYATCVDTMELSTGNDVQMRKCANTATGLQTATIVERNGEGNITPEGVLAATHDFFAKLFDNTTGALTTRIGSTEGNQFYIQAPGCQYGSISKGERGGIIVFNTDVYLNEIGSGNNELVIIAG